MNGKFEEKLAQLAFGDLSPEEAERIEAQVKNDPEALHALNVYHGMRSELKGLRDVPKDQMSKERLRDAILAQGLKPQTTPAKNPFGWLWMPAAACALAFGIMVLRGSGTSAPPSVVIDEHSIPDMAVAMREPISHPLTFDSVVSTPVAPKAVKQTARVEWSPVKSRPSRMKLARVSRGGEHRIAPITEEEKTAIEAAAWSELMASIETSAGDEARSDASMREASLLTASTAPIVIIEDKVDDSTGANAATEVGANNVLIGG